MSEASKRQEPADVGVRYASGSPRPVIDSALPISIRRQGCAVTSALIKVSSGRGFTPAVHDQLTATLPLRHWDTVGKTCDHPFEESLSNRVSSFIDLRMKHQRRAVASQAPVLPPHPRARVSRVISTANVSAAASRRPRSTP
jgi:hypothetical protein